MNERDSDGSTITPQDHGASASDTELTQRIRQAVMAADGLSMNAQNIKIVTLNGHVTLRGPVDTAVERDRIVALAQEIAGAEHVDNQLEVR